MGANERRDLELNHVQVLTFSKNTCSMLKFIPTHYIQTSKEKYWSTPPTNCYNRATAQTTTQIKNTLFLFETSQLKSAVSFMGQNQRSKI